MATSILDKYGIKEVADITFYALDKAGKPAYPVLCIDTAKTSTIEQTADETTANGGKGNVALISWDYNKDITVTLEDALFSAKSMAIMFGNGKVDNVDGKKIMKTEVFVAEKTESITDLKAGGATHGWDPAFIGPDGKKYTKLNPKFYDEEGKGVESVTANTKYFCSYDLTISKGSVIRINADTFPGTYYVTGDTWARPQAGGDDEFFQFIISKAKVKAENTITLEADGDPSVFNMDLHVLRPESGDMMKLVKYDLADGTDAGESNVEIYHNHTLNLAQDATSNAAVTSVDANDKARAMALDEDGSIINNIPTAQG